MLCAGQTYRTSITLENTDSAPASVTLAIVLADGTLLSPAPSPAGWVTTGGNIVNYYDYTLPAAGLYQFVWSTTGPNTAPVPDIINVRAYRSIVSMAETRAHLNKSSTASDDELAAMMMAATELVETKVGAILPTQVTDRVEEGRTRLLVEHKPIASVSLVRSIWQGGPAWDSTVLAWDSSAGLVYQQQPYDFWWGPWDVTYMTGRAGAIPERFIQAGKEQLRHLWETQRGGQPPAVLQGEEEFVSSTGWTFTVPRRVLELLEQDMVPSS